MIRLGVTGGFGTGKSTVCSFLKKKGAFIIDADELSHDCLDKGTSTYRKIVAAFGKGILDKKGRVTRRSLANKAFSDTARLKKLCSIIHPEVIARIRRAMVRQARRDKKSVAAVNVPLLYEAGLELMFDRVIVVKTSLKTQIERCREKTGLPESKIRRRINAQMPLYIKEHLADFVIDNDKGKQKTKKDVEKVWRKIIKMQKQQ
jgi:dephospho-CoA kinase